VWKELLPLFVTKARVSKTTEEKKSEQLVDTTKASSQSIRPKRAESEKEEGSS
jgi:hypothetical protein